MGEDFDVTWGGFASNFQKSFQKFGAEPDFSDVTLACEGGQVEAHRVVLAAGSPHLHALLKRNPEHRFIYLRGVDLPDLKDVVSYLYRGYMTVEQARLSSILALAEDLKVEGLYDRGDGGSAGSVEKAVKRRRPGGREVQVPQVFIDVYVKEEGEDSDPPFQGGEEGGGRAAGGTNRALGETVRDMRLEEHIKKVRGNFVCKICSKTTKRKDHMRDHVEAKHFGGTYVYACDICSDELPSKTAYTWHMRRRHK